MALTDEEKQYNTEVYGNLAEELHIAYREMRLAGFSCAESMNIIIAIISQPVKIDNYKAQTKIRRKNLDLLKERLKQVEKEKENEST